MTSGQWPGGGAVIETAAGPGPPVDAVAVGHGGRGDVAHRPLGLIDSPDEIDVLAHGHRLVEPVDLTQRVGTGEERGGGDERDAGASTYPTGGGSQIESGAVLFVAGEDRLWADRFGGHDARGGQRDDWIGEQWQQLLEPVGGRLAIGIDEGHEGCGDRLQAGVARGARPAAGGSTQQRDGCAAVVALGRLDGRIAGIVHHDHAGDTDELLQQCRGQDTPDGDDHGDVGEGERADAGHGLHHAAVEESAHERGRDCTCGHGIAGEASIDGATARLGESHHAQWRTAEQHGSATMSMQRVVGDDPEALE